MFIFWLGRIGMIVAILIGMIVVAGFTGIFLFNIGASKRADWERERQDAEQMRAIKRKYEGDS